MWQIWIDRGGTFTDLVAKKPNGELVTHKLLSENPEQYEDAALQGIRDLLGLDSGAPIPPGTVESVKMGTTVATNALLERKGDRTVLVITSGFGDVLRIGYQTRPRLFDMHIKLPELVYEQAIEAEERISAEGEILKPLAEDQLRADLQKSFDNGIRSVAIAFMHGYQHSAHEQRAGEIAREIGFTQVSVSHAVSPLIKLVSRGDTTVVDAYLSPILRRYVDRVAADLEAKGKDGPRLMFMQSNGGLTDAKIFQGKDSILSGPAGGVVGMVRTAQMAGFDKIIGFDMGGTSTDVAHFDGEYERTLETIVAGVRMRAPMMHIHTVAAGGGSILQFDGARFRVGPESAGANPGPACYRRDGPLAVTDCNVMLGKIQPEFFPSVFGPNADERLDADVVRQKFEALAEQIADATGEEKRSPEDVAEGFLTIAVENMANAIKQISVQRGYDVTEYVLNSFGGAGGQHACLVADALGMKTVLLHQFAGVLSAYGMGLADIRALREQTAQADLTDEALVSLNATLDDMAKDAVKEVSAQGLGDEKIDVYRRIHLRYDGTDSVIVVDLADAATMKENFEALHRQRFGFVPEGRKLVVEALAIEAVGITESTIDPEIEDVANRSAIQPISSVTMHSDGKNHETPVYSRDSFFPGDSITGPAIIAEDTGTTIVEPDWQASMNNRGHMILKRIKERPQIYAIGTKADPVLLEVFNNLFMSIAEQMGATLANTAYSVNIKERLDFSCAIFDIVGNLVANAPHMPIHLGSMGESIKTVIRENADTIKPGNVYALNAPYNGGTHLPDVTIITPVFDNDGKDILFYVGSRGHQADIGGRTPGSAPPDSTSIHEEGVLIDNFLLVEEGRLREKETYELLGSGQYPCRNPSQNMADLIAQIAANETGVRELRKMIDHFGLDVVHAYMGHVQDNAEESVRRVLDVLSDCEFTYPMDNGDTIQVKISVDKAAREALIDFTGTSPQGNHNYNAPLAVCKAAVLYVFRTLVDDEIPLNEGCLKPLKIKVPKKSIISPEYPAAVIAGNTEVSQCITDTLYGALGVIASAQGTMNNFVYGNDVYQNYETICGGTGAGPDFDGTDAVHSHMTNTRLTDIEVLENRFPVRVEEFSIRRGSGGEGAHTGGAGVVRKMRFLEGMTATILSSHRHTDPYGLKGGGPGKRGNNTVVRTDGTVDQLRGNDETEMAPGDVFVIETPGGGGFGAK
ncbi:hydantoinase B/oxoprolinase family protein [Rhodospirillales bacterium]|nr:hydantoinase B/oxoprolinase family protein [Rhodospirillales bacterium]